jgi:hypothetical protein
MAKQKPVPRIRAQGATFLHYYEQNQKKLESANAGNRRLIADKAQQAVLSESLRFAKRNVSDLIDWALMYTQGAADQSNVLSMSGAVKIETPEAKAIRVSLGFCLDVLSRFSPAEAEQISYRLVIGVLHRHKKFVKDLDDDGATKMIQEAIDLSMGHVKIFEDQAHKVREQAIKEQKRLRLSLLCKKYAIAALGVCATVGAGIIAFGQ